MIDYEIWRFMVRIRRFIAKAVSVGRENFEIFHDKTR